MADSYFGLFGLPARFTLDTTQLEQAYRNVLAQVHPDRFAQNTPAAQREALQRATTVNEAYRTLRSAAPRARYLLQLQGVPDSDASALPRPFLMQQMLWREAMAEAQEERSLAALGALRTQIAMQGAALEQRLAQELDVDLDLPGAASLVQQLVFLEKTLAAIDDACAALED
jgi:molecular chaperone HscB